MGSMSNAKEVSNLCSTLRVHPTNREGARTAFVPILVDAPTAAAVLSISERAFHTLRKRSEFPSDATVVLGPRCVRFRLEALYAFARSLALSPKIEPRQPPRRVEVRRGRERRSESGAPLTATAERNTIDADESVPN